MFAWSQGLIARANLDKNERLKNFGLTLERVIVATVESGFMTKDLAILVHGTSKVDRSQYLNTFEFIDKVAENLVKALTEKKVNPDSSYKFFYFPLHVRGEPIRMLLSHANAEWRDMIVPFDKWPSMKPEMPNGQMPCLQLRDGTKMGESYAISRYLGSMYGYYPSDPKLALEIDYLLEGQDALLSVIYKPQITSEEWKKRE